MRRALIILCAHISWDLVREDMLPGGVGNITWFIVNTVPEYNARDLNHLTAIMTKQPMDMTSCIVYAHGVSVQIGTSVGIDDLLRRWCHILTADGNHEICRHLFWYKGVMVELMEQNYL